MEAISIQNVRRGGTNRAGQDGRPRVGRSPLVHDTPIGSLQAARLSQTADILNLSDGTGLETTSRCRSMRMGRAAAPAGVATSFSSWFWLLWPVSFWPDPPTPRSRSRARSRRCCSSRTATITNWSSWAGRASARPPSISTTTGSPGWMPRTWPEGCSSRAFRGGWRKSIHRSWTASSAPPCAPTRPPGSALATTAPPASWPIPTARCWAKAPTPTSIRPTGARACPTGGRCAARRARSWAPTWPWAASRRRSGR